MKIFGNKLESKKNPIGNFLVLGNKKAFGSHEATAFIKEGYQYNPIIYRCIKQITSGLADINIEVHNKKTKQLVEDHPVMKLLDKPNPVTGCDTFIKNLFTDYLITGEMSAVRYPLKSKNPVEIWAVNSSNIVINKGEGGLPASYEYDSNGVKRIFKVNQLNGRSDIFFQKMYNPLDYWRGMSPLKAASLAGDTHNHGMKWNNSLLQNSGRPSGIVTLEGASSPEIIERLKEYFKKTFQGSKNAGEIPVLTDGADWKPMDHSPKDMDNINGLKEMSKYIANVYGIPLPLIDDTKSTFNNMESSKEALWTDTIIPLFNEFLEHFGNWLLPLYGEDLIFKANLDSVPALEPARTRLFDRMIKAKDSGMISIDEGREALGFDKRGGMADDLLIASSVIPVDMIGEDFNDAADDLDDPTDPDDPVISETPLEDE